MQSLGGDRICIPTGHCTTPQTFKSDWTALPHSFLHIDFLRVPAFYRGTHRKPRLRDTSYYQEEAVLSDVEIVNLELVVYMVYIRF